MSTSCVLSHVRRSMMGFLSVLGIVIASAIGLHEWADDAAVDRVDAITGRPAAHTWQAKGVTP
jgi:hypothetical protein